MEFSGIEHNKVSSVSVRIYRNINMWGLPVRFGISVELGIRQKKPNISG